MQHLNNLEILLLARILKMFEDMGASVIELEIEKRKFITDPNLIYAWANTLHIGNKNAAKF